MKKEISIDVIIPCYNEKNTIQQVIEKVQYQKLNNLQIIVVDDNSTDGSMMSLSMRPSSRILNWTWAAKCQV